MKIQVNVVGPCEKLKGLFIAKGKAGEKDCTVLLAQKGENAALVCHSGEPSMIGNGLVISYSGNTLARGKVAPGEQFAFEVNANMRPVKPSQESINDRVARLENDNKELRQMLSDTLSLLEQNKPAASADEASNTPPAETEKPE